jgi:excisionase family DNA binding protein
MELKDIERKTYEVKEAGRMLGLGTNAAYRAVHKRQIPSIKVGGRYLVPKILFDRMLEQTK